VGLVVKEPGRRLDRPVPFSAQVKNKWSYTSVAALCPRGVDRDNFTFTFS
jgi:hypothetical protein